jgi:hypothetical protein
MKKIVLIALGIVALLSTSACDAGKTTLTTTVTETAKPITTTLTSTVTTYTVPAGTTSKTTTTSSSTSSKTLTTTTSKTSTALVTTTTSGGIEIDWTTISAKEDLSLDKGFIYIYGYNLVETPDGVAVQGRVWNKNIVIARTVTIEVVFYDSNDNIINVVKTPDIYIVKEEEKRFSCEYLGAELADIAKYTFNIFITAS